MTEEPGGNYVNRMDGKFGPLEVIDEREISDHCPVPWFNQTLCEVSDTWVRLGVCEGVYHWHRHDDSDEFFYVIEGRWVIDLEGRSVELGPRQGFAVPKGERHRPRAPMRTTVLMAERRGVVPTGT